MQNIEGEKWKMIFEKKFQVLSIFSPSKRGFGKFLSENLFIFLFSPKRTRSIILFRK